MEVPEVVYGIYTIDGDQYWSFSVKKKDIEKLKEKNTTWIGPIEFTFKQAFSQYSADQYAWEEINPSEKEFLDYLDSWNEE